MKKLKDGWILEKVGELFDIQLGKMLNQKAIELSPKYPYLGNSNVRWGAFDLENLKTMYFSEKEMNKFSLKRNDILMCEGGEVGRCAIWENENGEIYYQKALHRLRSKGKILPSYFYHYMTFIAGTKLLDDQTTKTSIAHLTREKLSALKIPVPPLNEQIQIAKTLSTWDNAIQITEKLIENSRQQKKALMQRLLGEGEKTFLLEDLGSTFTGLSGKSKVNFGKGKPYIPYMNIFTNSHIDIQQLELVEIGKDEKQNKVKYGDIFFTTSSETPDEVGMSSVLLDEVNELYLNSFCFGFRLNNFENLLPEYAQYLFRSCEIRKAISLLGQGATRYNLSKTQLMKLSIKLPNLEEQRKIADILSTADQEIETLQHKLECLKLEKKALMQRLL